MPSNSFQCTSIRPLLRISPRICTFSSHVFTSSEFSIRKCFFEKKKCLFYKEKNNSYIGILLPILILKWKYIISKQPANFLKKIRFRRFRMRENMWWTRYRSCLKSQLWPEGHKLINLMRSSEVRAFQFRFQSERS